MPRFIMSDIRQFMNNIFDKYSIYNRRQFVSLTIYVIKSILNKTIEYENENQYCIGFFKLLFDSVPFDSIPTNVLFALVDGARDTQVQLLDNLETLSASSNFGKLIDDISDLMLRSSLQNAEDFEGLDGFNISFNQNMFTINGVSSSTLRGCIWKLIYANLIYKLNSFA